MANKNTTLPTSKIPTKWLAIIIFVLVGYGLCQPFVNRKFGWNWPTLSSVLGIQDKAKKADDSKNVNDRDNSNSSARKGSGSQSSKSEPSLSAEELERQLLDGDSGDRDSGSSDLTDKTSDAKQSSEVASKTSKSNSTSKSESSSAASAQAKNSSKSQPEKAPQSNSDASTKTSTSAGDSKLLYGFLKDLGRENYLSPAGLRYTRGSEEGHRLKHIERHLEDQPERSGSHGVFDGDMAQVLRWIDDAYTRAKSRAKGTSAKEDDDGNGLRTVYEASFTKPIGYIGGRDGARKKNPPAKHLRLVVDEEHRVITAFPF